jgi:hypothetical protein
MLPLGIQYKLLAHKIVANDIEEEAPPEVGQDVVMLRKTLNVATQAFFRCEVGDDSQPASLQSKLEAFLHADQTKRADNSPEVYGANLAVHIEPAKGLPDSLFVVLTFGIECGDDNLLFLYTKEDGRWHQRLHWYSDKYTAPSDAFGDFFLYTVAPGPNNQSLIAIAHGTPWCSSRMSAFHIDLFRPSDDSAPLKPMAHLDDYYSRFDVEPRLKAESDGFEIRLQSDSLDEATLVRPGIYRYRTTEGQLRRIQPIALNAREFVDAWLQAPWTDSSEWALDPTPSLHATRDRFDYSLQSNKNSFVVDYGPTRTCTSGSNHFQVEIDLSDFIQVNNKTEEKDLPTLYAQVRQNPNSFTMLSITDKPDPTCTGPDLMKKPGAPSH